MIKDLKIRTISAIILLAIIIPLVIIGNIPFDLAIGLISILAFIEIIRLNNYPMIIKICGLISMILLVYSNFNIDNIAMGLNYKIVSCSLLLLLIPTIIYQNKNMYDIKDAFTLFAFIFLVGLGLNNFILIRDLGLKYFAFVLLIPIFNDIFAYIGGSLVGKHHFTEISPNKSIEGCLIGLIMGTFIMTMYYITFMTPKTSIILVIGIITLLGVIGQIGDIFFSAIKRRYDIKDFSKLIPGHGGILDRLDSLVFVALLFMVFIELL